METGEARNPRAEADSKARKKFLLRLWLIAAAVMGLLTAVLLFAALNQSVGKYDALYDDPEALAGPDCFSSWMSSNHHRGNTWQGSIGKLSGVNTLFSCKAKGDTWGELDYTLEVTRGKAKLILVDPAGNVTTIQECLAGESAQKVVSLTLPKGTSYVKLVGAEEAELSWQVEMN